MPLHTLRELTDQPVLHEAGQAVARQRPGIVLATGQASSGKVTMLLALVQEVARPGQPVSIFSEIPGEFDVFQPLPPSWRVRVVGTTAQDWRAALSDQDPDAIIVVSALRRESAPALWAAAGQRWAFASVETPLLGHDVAYALRDMGVGYNEFLGKVRCVWSQLLLDALCEHCSQPAELGPAELAYLFPAGQQVAAMRLESGCAECAGQGVHGREAVSEVLLVSDASRGQVAAALDQGHVLPAHAQWHITVQDQARTLLGQGRIGVGVYRDAIRRNPLLRAQNQFEREQAHSTRVATMFEKFVSPEVKRRLMDSRALHTVVQGESRDISCLFCDMRGFTARAEARTPEQLFSELNLYFSEVVDCVLATEGTIDKFIGDAVMVVWGAPLEQHDHAQRAVRCALDIRQRLAAFNAAHSEDLPVLVGMGINSGPAVAGCIGTEQRMEYTVLGDTVNIAARLESKAAAGQILASRSTREATGAAFRFGAAKPFELKGKTAPVDAFEVLG